MATTRTRPRRKISERKRAELQRERKEINALAAGALADPDLATRVPAMLRGASAYRERVRDLVRGGRAYARIIGGQVVFKAELAVITRHTAQIQGVWTAPDWRGHGMATAGMAAVVRDALGRVAPSVSLYVNDYNEPARRVYARCGFRPVGTFATVLF